MSNPVPEGWKVTPLENILYRPLAYGVLKPGENVKNGVPVVRIQDIRGNRLNFDGLYKISSELHREFRRTKLNEGDLIISLVGTIGKTFVVPASLQDANVTRAFGVIGVQEAVSPEYVTQWLNSDSSQQWIQDQSQGNAQKVLNLGALKQFPLQLPPLPEQQKIAAILSSVDGVIEKTRAQIDKLKDLKTGMMQELLTKGIGHTEFKDSPVGRIPASWDVRYISDLCSNIVDCVNKTAPVVDHVTPYRMIRTTNVRNGRIVMDGMRYVSQKTFQSWSRRLALKAGDLIFTREAPVGECGLVRDAKGLFLGQRTMVYRAASEKLDSGFLLWSMLSEYCQNQIEDLSGGSTTPHLRVPDCGKILLKVPPLAEQRGISSAIQSVATLLEERETKVAHLTGLKKALMQDLLTGKVRVNVGENETAVA